MKKIEDIYPLSPMQKGMLFHTLRDPHSGVYHEQSRWTIRGPLDTEAFRYAWQKVIDGHPALRTAFVWQQIDEPHQVVFRNVKASIEMKDWRHLGDTEQERKLDQHLRIEREKGFELTSAPLMRIILVRVEDEVYRLVWSHHHLILDGWSRPLVFREIFAYYEAFIKNERPLVEPARPYRDYIAWLNQKDRVEMEAFWRRYLANFASPTLLDNVSSPFLHRPEAGGSEIDYEVKRRILREGLSDKLRKIALAHRLTLYTFIQGAWALLLSRYGNERDVLFGSTVSGRPPEIRGVERMIGLFINTLPVRIKIPEGMSVVNWLEQIQDHQAEIRQFEHGLLVDIQGWSGLPPDRPLFESLLVFENYPVDRTSSGALSGLIIEADEFLSRTNYPLTLAVSPGKDLGVMLAYDSSRFHVEVIDQIADHFEFLLQGMSEDMNGQLDDLPLLTVEEERLLMNWNASRSHCGEVHSILELFESQAAQSPDAIAICFGNAEMNYTELNRRVNQLAWYLRRSGVGPEAVVGLCVERSLEMIVGLLGVLKAGGAYLPLDPAYPPERLGFLLEDSRVKVLLTQRHLLDRFPSVFDSAHPLVCLDTDWSDIARESDEPSESAVSADHSAYIIYTSGSTGEPKGVQVTRRSLVNHALSLKGMLGLSVGDRICQFISLSFDASAEEIFPGLLSGATLVLPPPGGTLSSVEFLKFCEGERITVLHLPVPFWHQWVSDLSAEGLSVDLPLKALLVGGESPSIERLKTWIQMIGRPARFLNAYGPTEATITTTVYSMPHPPPDLARVPIGRTIPNVQAYVLDKEGRLMPVYASGELYIGGAGIARGYLNRPDLTSERFVPDPFGEDPGGRLYRTGDLVRWLPNGELVFLGRMDHQVKIRGFRIELGEVETVLNRHPSVCRSVVTAREDGSGEKFLSAYVVLEKGMNADGRDLRDYLREKLPSHMSPSTFTFLSEFPLTPSGKIDRKALPAPEGMPGGEGYVSPRTPIEGVLSEIWAKVLGVERVGVEDHFYDLGGHSLKATQLISRVQKAFGVEIPLRDLFETLTVSRLAERVEAALKGTSGVLVPPIEKVSREGDLPLSFSQERLWFLDQLAPENLFYNIPLAVRLKGALDVGVFRESLKAITDRHEVLRTHFSSVNGRPVQVIEAELDLRLTVEDLSGLPEGDRESHAGMLLTEEVRRPFDLTQGPLLRARLLKLSEEDHIALLVIHHIVTDGWSMGVMIEELGSYYRAFLEGGPSPLPAPAVQYADFAHWQRHWLQGEVLERHLAYWRERLRGSPPMLDLPTDRPRKAIQSPKGEIHPFRLSETLSESLRKLSREQGVTIFMTLLGAFQVLLYRYTGQEDLTVGIPIANRNRGEIEGLMGFFVNTLVIRGDLSKEHGSKEVLRRVREAALGAYTHQDLPFEVLVEALQPKRDLSHTPLFQVMFTMDVPMPQGLVLPGLTLEPVEVHRGAATFDLTLSMREVEDGLSGYVEYNTDLFDEATIERMLGHYERLLEGIVADPDQPISTLPLLTDVEAQDLLEAFNATEVKTPTDRCVHELFEARAEERPQAPAVIFEEQVLSYGELNRRANRLAHFLLKLGVGPEVLVGIATDRSPEMIVGILGVLKAGGAYLPLDPAYPPDRLSFMVEDSQAKVLLTQSHLLDRLPDPLRRNPDAVLALDADWGIIAREPDHNPPLRGTPDHLAYVIYTSGSTGKPKGAMLSHRGLSNLTGAQREAFGIGEGSRVLQFSPLSFDASVWETFMALANGGALCLARQEVLASGVELARLIQDKGVTHVTLPPSVARVLPAEKLPTLRTVIAAGEKCTGELVERWAEGREFFNAYGPTETTVCASMRICRKGDGPPPIGRPIANGQLFALDGNFQPVPMGVPGELCVGGVSLARGYLRRPELTAEKFIPNPFASGGARLYRTGDLVRTLPEGEIEFLGRIDDQVKVRGFRIELGEIETVLTQVEGVREGVVVAQGERLVAYVVAQKEVVPTVGDLRIRMRESLPEYMVPSIFLFLDELPLSPSGKVDRKALPIPEGVRPELEREYVAPRTPLEEQLARMCSELLEMERVGIHDNFFELGGHSLLATQLISRIREEIGVDLPLRTFFEHPTIGEIAEELSEAEAKGWKTQGPTMTPISREAHRMKRSAIH